MSRTSEEEYLHRNLSPEAEAEAKCLTPMQLLKVAGQVRAIWNNACMDCQLKMRLTPAKFKNIDDMCWKCQENQIIINCFRRLEGIHKDAMGDKT